MTPGSARRITFRAASGRPAVEAVLLTRADDRGLLLLHRLTELHARVPVGRFPIGATTADRVVDGSTAWTSGFWPGALWQAAAIAPAGGLFAHWALSATLAHLGRERADSHDVGFMYLQSSLAAWRALCMEHTKASRTCARLKRSVIAAADQLRTLAASNARARTIPTTSTAAPTATIVDSMLNIEILPWAGRLSGDAGYTELARQHALAVARLLVRPDGSAIQVVHLDRRTGRVMSAGTRQGLDAGSTWARGEAWALYGFSQAAVALHDQRLLGVARRLGEYVAAHVPADAIPRWDYDAPAGAPVDVSAGVITAAGLLHLAQACRLPECRHARDRWQALGRRMLAAALARASRRPPLGPLGSQVLDERLSRCWSNGGEVTFGLTYALEALRLEDAAGG